MNRIIKKYKYIFVSIIILILSIICGNILNEDTKTMPTGGTTLNSECIGWGLKRAENHAQPDFESKNKALIEKYGGIVIGNKDRKNVYLTFDMGYEAGYTTKILETLKNNSITACFFITAHYLNDQPDLVGKMLEEGHLIGNHTVNHKSMPSITDNEIKKEIMDLHKAVYEKFAYEMLFFRPPKGEFNERTLKVTNELGYKTVMWSFAYADWEENNQPGEEEAKEKILSNVHNGEIMLLHATSKTNASILDAVIKEIKNMGYEFKNLDCFE